MSWLIIAIVAHFLFAIVFLVDKYLLVRPVHHTDVFAFYIGMTSLGIFVLAPFGLRVIDTRLILISFIAGAIFIYGLVALFHAYQRMDISDVAPIGGAITAIFTLSLSRFFVPEDITGPRLIAFILLVAGSAAIAFRKNKFEKAVIYILIVSFLHALSFVLVKYVFIQTDFINGLIWTRLGMALGALSLLLIPHVGGAIIRSLKKTSRRDKTLFVGNKILAGTATLMILLAIYLGSVNFVNALIGIQFIFLMAFVVLFSKRFPFMKQERLYKLGWIQKAVALVLIVAGLFVLGFNI